ncbi:MAG TPA: Smr/MutS family protein [Stellaceae bacterium]|nr:Smr/MutS family protein [Stellaceae bacterium]
MRDVEPLEPAAGPPPPPSQPEAPPRMAREPAAAAPAGRPAASGLDRRSAQRLKRGALPLEGRLDLHGMTREEAHRALQSFLARAQEAGKRCVLVITGKGGGERGGVLRAEVPRWLDEGPNRGRVLAKAAAQPRDGGAGALYVLLRRKR